MTSAAGPTLTIAAGGSFAKLSGCGGPAHGGGIRGRVVGFSAQSRKRLLDLLNMLKRETVSDAVFLTLTYPDVFPVDAHRWKRDLDAVSKALARKYPQMSAIWRLEWKKRLSGENVGRMAPHFHLLVFGVPWLDLVWLSKTWYRVVGSGDEKHLQAGTSAERVRSWRGVMHYCSKYIGKPAAESFGGWTGRCYGVLGRENLAIRLLVVPLTWQQFYSIRRVMRSWLRKRLGRKRRRDGWRWNSGNGVTCYLTDDIAARLLAWSVVT